MPISPSIIHTGNVVETHGVVDALNLTRRFDGSHIDLDRIFAHVVEQYRSGPTLQILPSFAVDEDGYKLHRQPPDDGHLIAARQYVTQLFQHFSRGEPVEGLQTLWLDIPCEAAEGRLDDLSNHADVSQDVWVAVIEAAVFQTYEDKGSFVKYFNWLKKTKSVDWYRKTLGRDNPILVLDDAMTAYGLAAADKILRWYSVNVGIGDKPVNGVSNAERAARAFIADLAWIVQGFEYYSSRHIRVPRRVPLRFLPTHRSLLEDFGTADLIEDIVRSALRRKVQWESPPVDECQLHEHPIKSNKSRASEEAAEEWGVADPLPLFPECHPWRRCSCQPRWRWPNVDGLCLEVETANLSDSVQSPFEIGSLPKPCYCVGARPSVPPQTCACGNVCRYAGTLVCDDCFTESASRSCCRENSVRTLRSPAPECRSVGSITSARTNPWQDTRKDSDVIKLDVVELGLEVLTPEERQLAYLTDSLDMTDKEAAKELDVSLSTVQKRKKKIRDTIWDLRDLLGTSLWASFPEPGGGNRYHSDTETATPA